MRSAWRVAAWIVWFGMVGHRHGGRSEHQELETSPRRRRPTRLGGRLRHRRQTGERWRTSWSGVASGSAFLEGGLEKPARSDGWAPFAAASILRSGAGLSLSLGTRLSGRAGGLFEREGAATVETRVASWRMGVSSWAKAKGEGDLLQAEAGTKGYAGRDVGRFGRAEFAVERTARSSRSGENPPVTLETSAVRGSFVRAWGDHALELSVHGSARTGSRPSWSVRLEYRLEL